MLCVPRYHVAKVDISLLLKPRDEEEQPSPQASSRSASSVTVPSTTATTVSTASVPAKRAQPAHSFESPAKKQSKWSAEEDAQIIELRGKGMKWEDISKQLPGRSAISCRLHYQNYLERRSEWDEDRKNKLARLYERFKAEMWSKVAEEMSIPWRAAEAMHWQLGEGEMARRAGVTPFSLASAGLELPPKGRRGANAIPRSRRESTTRSMPPQLPSVSELTAGVPAYAPNHVDNHDPRIPPYHDPYNNAAGQRK